MATSYEQAIDLIHAQVQLVGHRVARESADALMSNKLLSDAQAVSREEIRAENAERRVFRALERLHSHPPGIGHPECRPLLDDLNPHSGWPATQRVARRVIRDLNGYEKGRENQS